MKKILIILASVFVIFLIYAFAQSDRNVEESFVQEVVVQQASEPTIEKNQTFGAKVKNIDEVIISAQIMGTINNITVNEGDIVRKGQNIGSINAGEYVAQYQQALSMVQIAEEQEKLARRKWDDYKPEERAQFKLETQRSRAFLSESRAYLAKSQIIAPFDGVISTKFISEGSSVTVGDAIVRVIGDATKEEITFDVLQEIAESFALEDVVDVVGGEDRSAAVIYAIDPVADEQTRKVRLHAQIQDPQIFDVGEYVDVHISTSISGSVDSDIPLDALVRFYDDYVAFVVTEDRVRMVRVDVVAINGENASIKNIAPGEQIVVRGAHQLHDGDVVTILNEK